MRSRRKQSTSGSSSIYLFTLDLFTSRPVILIVEESAASLVIPLLFIHYGFKSWEDSKILSLRKPPPRALIQARHMTAVDLSG
ncbi:MAG: hypothetical protein QXZ05_06185, partial [Sulfolobales archaeon]